MKAALFVSALAGSAHSLHFRHLNFHKRDAIPAPEYPCCKNVVTVTVTATPVAAPTPYVTAVPTPGVYVVPETPGSITVPYDTTLTVTTTAAVTPGTNIIGDTTIIASVSTIEVFPVAQTFPSGVYSQQQSTVTAIYTSQVFICPYESTAYVTKTEIAVATEHAQPEAPAPEAPAPAPEAPAPAAPSAPAPAPPAGGIITNGKKWAMTYTPYRTDGTCKDAGEVNADVADIKNRGFTTLRLYGTDCSGLPNVGSAAIANGLKLILGVFIKGDGISGARPQIAEIVSWGNGGNWGSVVMLVVGNECINDNICDAGSLASFISEAKGALTGAGQGGIPVTTTEPLNALMASKDVLCPVIDVVAANIQSFFNGGVEAAQAGTFVKSQLDLVAQQCPGKPAYNLESGWPSGGSANGVSQANPEAQKAAMADIVDKAGENTVVFSYQDDSWKVPGALGVEPHFGCSQYF